MDSPADLGRHGEKVARIAARVATLSESGEPVHISKGGVHHVVPVPRDRRFSSRALDVSDLTEILDIDAAGKVCVAEAGVTFADLVNATMEHGLMPAVVPELKGITIGGAVSGCSVESTSFRHGGFHDSCLEYEIVTGDGRVLTCSREQDPLIFEMMHGSYGTLGLLTKLSFRLVPAQPFVRMEYKVMASADRFLEELREETRRGEHDFIDGIVHGSDEFVLCLGTMCDKAPYTSNYSGTGIYYKSTRDRDQDYLTIEDYFFRYDADLHWITRTVPPLQWKAVRATVGRAFLGSTNMINWSKRLDRILGLKKRPDVVVDVFIPATRFTEFYEWYESELDFFPMWIVPYRMPEPYPWLAEGPAEAAKDELMIDCAVYGMRNNDPHVDYSEALEKKTHEVGGVKTLISRNHYTRDRFWTIYNSSNYYSVKEKTDPQGLFPDLFEKFHRVG
jgi:FAD/FMN-containing dehydrogenase